MTKKAAPAFQFYPGDFTSGAPGRMKPIETHVYVWLLCNDWMTNGFEYDADDLAHWCRISVPRFKKAWAKVGKNFVERDGRFFNPRLDKERKKQQTWREKSAEGGRLGAKKRWPIQQGGIQGGNTTLNRVLTPPHTPNDHQINTLQTTSKKVRSTSNPPKTSQSGALNGARTREQDELDDLNRSRMARGEEPVDAL